MTWNDIFKGAYHSYPFGSQEQFSDGVGYSWIDSIKVPLCQKTAVNGKRDGPHQFNLRFFLGGKQRMFFKAWTIGGIAIFGWNQDQAIKKWLLPKCLVVLVGFHGDKSAVFMNQVPIREVTPQITIHWGHPYSERYGVFTSNVCIVLMIHDDTRYTVYWTRLKRPL